MVALAQFSKEGLIKEGVIVTGLFDFWGPSPKEGRPKPPVRFSRALGAGR